MMFSTRSEYGVRVMIAARPPPRRGPGPARPSIADGEALPLALPGASVARLREAGLVRSTRGARGGYELRAPGDDDHDGGGGERARGHDGADAVLHRAGRDAGALQPRDRRLRPLRHAPAVDPSAGRRNSGAGADDARGAGRVRRARRPAEATAEGPHEEHDDDRPRRSPRHAGPHRRTNRKGTNWQISRSRTCT